MKRHTLALAIGITFLANAAPAWSQGGRGGGGARGGGGPATRPGAATRPSRDSDLRNPGVPRGRSDRGSGDRDTPGRRPERREQPSRVQRHRDQNGDGRPDRHHRTRPRIWWPYFFGGFGYSSFGYRSPFYDPFYSGFYQSEAIERDSDLSNNVTVRIKPDHARILVNGLLYSAKGRTTFDLPVGTWTVEIAAPGYRTEVVTLKVEQGVRYQIERKLEKDPTQDSRGRPLKEEVLPSR